MLNATKPAVVKVQSARFDDLRARIVACSGDLPKKLAEAASYALSHPDDFALGTAAQIAISAKVQPSTLVRLAQHLGYEGFSDFQSVFRDRLRFRASSYEKRLQQLNTGTHSDSVDFNLLGGFLSAARQSIDGLSATLDADQFAKSVDLLAKADTLYLVARRRSYPLAAHMAYAFAKLGVKAITIDSANSINDELLAFASPTDAAIVCSFLPYAAETVANVAQLYAQKVPIIAITDSALSPIAGKATHWLEVAEADFAGFRSLSASMALAASLPVAVAERRRIGG